MSFDLISLPLNEIASFKYGKTIRKQDIEVVGTYPVHSGYTIVGYLPTYMYEDEQLLIVCRGAGGTGDIKLSPPQVSITNLAIVISCDESKVCKEYLYWVLKLADTYSLRTGSAQPQITINSLDSFNVAIHQDLGVQKKIATFLDKLNSKVNINTQTNHTLEQMAQAIFKSWFVDFEPVKAKMNGKQPEGMNAETASLFPEKLVESELGLIPEGWEVGALSSVVDVIMGQSPKGSTYNDQNEGTPLVNGPVEFGVYHPVAQKWTTAPTKMSKNKDLIVCVRGSTTGRYVVSDGEYCLGRGVCSIRSNDFPSFANYLFKSELNSLLHLTTGSTFPSWSGPTLKNFKVVVPPETIIEKFELLVGKLCEMMARNTGQNETLSTLRDTLLPKLLSGEIDLGETNPESIKEDV
ncbi:restriction endonuclease subunit S [Vibrio harveyi]|uniref:restriction endonuclease subunit S n=1 Tax=Vibrio harveyi TaxID=669 RepID=UPI00234D53C4|nr:restriction endonuclease subunit S [Vibrio harveyi]WCP82848.1 restriction endonuclease subunit S [Vibrio harveyi]